MADFMSSVKMGLAAARVAEKNKREIDEVFSDLNHQIGLVSNGTVEIVRKEFYEPTNDLFTNALARLVSAKTYIGIAIKHAVHQEYHPKEIARWTQGQDGYPCWIKTQDMDIACENKEALEKGLAALLSSPRTGEQIFIAMRFEPKAKPAP